MKAIKALLLKEQQILSNNNKAKATPAPGEPSDAEVKRRWCILKNDKNKGSGKRVYLPEDCKDLEKARKLIRLHEDTQKIVGDIETDKENLVNITKSVYFS